MLRLIADENVPRGVILALRDDGLDLVWMSEIGPGTPDEGVLTLSVEQGRILLTFDKDFGDLTFRLGRRAAPGVILLRPRLRTRESLVMFARAVLAQDHDWAGHFAVAEEGRLRLVPLPG